LDDTLYEVKKLIDDAVQLDREKFDLRSQGAGLQKYIDQIKLDRERIVTQEETPLQSMHQVAATNGLSYHRVDQLLKLNPQIKNPTFTSGAIKVLAKD